MEVCQLPEIYQTNLKRALQILKEEGCSAVFLFRSLTTGLFKPDSDIDLAIQGCPLNPSS